MCGITGFWSAEPLGEEAEAWLRTMTATLVHRGPDSSGSFVDRAAGVALGHRRLAIVDLTREGHQPMWSASGRFCVSYNGEVYNFRELRRDLEARGHLFRGGSDTEVLLACVEEHGLAGALERFVGMFALALWDAGERRLHLVRDRLGIKPMYFARTARGVLFGSELRALRAHPAFDDAIDRAALAAYLRFNCVPAPHTIHAGTRKLRPGTVLTFDHPRAEGREHVYWSAAERARAALEQPLRGTERESAERLEDAIREAVRLRLVADVPLGAFLSGGIDSSTVVALMQELCDRPVRTFSIGNETADFDEGEAAARVARHLGTDHTALVVGAAEALAVIEKLPAMFDEPFADSSQIPTFLVSQLARRHVTVALSGDGGDELFGGYNRHFWGPSLWRLLRWVPRGTREAAARGIAWLPPSAWDAAFRRARRVLPEVRLPGQQMHKLAGVLGAADPTDLYLRLSSHWAAPLGVVRGASAEARRCEPAADGLAFAEVMMLTDLVTYLPDDILTKVDRASMAVSLEARVPLLDHRVVELAWRIPLAHKVRGRVGKRALRRILARRVPRELWDRPKMGFGVPIGEWLRGPLRPWADALLDEGRLAGEGFFEPREIRARWREHLSGARGWQHALWDVLMFQAWHEHVSRDRPKVPAAA